MRAKWSNYSMQRSPQASQATLTSAQRDVDGAKMQCGKKTNGRMHVITVERRGANVQSSRWPPGLNGTREAGSSREFPVLSPLTKAKMRWWTD